MYNKNANTVCIHVQFQNIKKCLTNLCIFTQWCILRERGPNHPQKKKALKVINDFIYMYREREH